MGCPTSLKLRRALPCFAKSTQGGGFAAYFFINAMLDGLVVEDEGLAEEGVEAGVALTGFAGLRAEGAMGEGEQGAEEAASGAGVCEGDGDGLKGPLEKRWDVGVLEDGI